MGKPSTASDRTGAFLPPPAHSSSEQGFTKTFCALISQRFQPPTGLRPLDAQQPVEKAHPGAESLDPKDGRLSEQKLVQTSQGRVASSLVVNSHLRRSVEATVPARIVSTQNESTRSYNHKVVDAMRCQQKKRNRSPLPRRVVKGCSDQSSRRCKAIGPAP